MNLAVYGDGLYRFTLVLIVLWHKQGFHKGRVSRMQSLQLCTGLTWPSMPKLAVRTVVSIINVQIYRAIFVCMLAGADPI